MLDYSEIHKISKKLEKISKKIETRNLLDNKKFDIPSMDFERLDNSNINNLIAEDSGYVTGTIGPFSYIYIRTVALDSKGNIKRYSNIYLSDAQFLERKKISDIAEIISRISEYYVVYDLLGEEDIVLFDGSLIADIVSSSAAILNFVSLKEAKNIISEELEKEDILKALENSYLDDSYVRLVHIIFPVVIRQFLDLFGEKLLYFVKRPIHSRTISRKLGLGVSDLLLLLRTYKEKPFVTQIYEEILENELFGKVTIKIMYYRLLKNGHIYKVESPYSGYEKIGDIIRKYSTLEGYPKLLLYAHALSNVSINDKNFIEGILQKYLPKGFGSKEITKFI